MDNDNINIVLGLIFFCMLIMIGIICCAFTDGQTSDSIIKDAKLEYFMSISENMTQKEKYIIAQNICNDIATDPIQINRFIPNKISPPNKMYNFEEYCISNLLGIN